MKKKYFITVIVIICMLMCTGCGAAKSTEASKPEKNGFDESTNVTYTYSGISFSVPAYFGEENVDDFGNRVFYAEKGNGKTMMLLFTLIEDKFEDKYLNEESIKEMAESYFNGIADNSEKGSVGDISDISFSGFSIKKAAISKEVQDVEVEAVAYLVIDKNNGSAVGIMAGRTKTTDFDYFSDVEKIVLSAKEQPAAADSSADGVSPELKEAMDSYEQFFDKYIEFMKKYKNSSNPTSMLSDYMEYLTQYTETMEKMNAIKQEELTGADLKYYVEVTTRITGKLVEVGY